MTASTPIARSKSAALSRVVHLVPRGYEYYVQGIVPAHKAPRLAEKFHQKYGIGCTPAQRATRKNHGLANTALVLYWPEGASHVEWLLLATKGNGLEDETLKRAAHRKEWLFWLGYQLVRRNHRGDIAWTWKLPRQVIAQYYEQLRLLATRGDHDGIADLLILLSRLPGFHGIRQQLKTFFTEVHRRQYDRPLPKLFYMPKIKHGEPLKLGAGASNRNSV